MRVRLVMALAMFGAAVSVVAFQGAPMATAATVPSGFADALVESVPSPTALAFLPDGRMLVTAKSGIVSVLTAGSLHSTGVAVIDLSPQIGPCTNSERGLLGVTPDSRFASTGQVFVYYTSNETGSCVNKVARFTMVDNLAVQGTLTTILDGIPSPNGNHNGGDLRFGADGYLYVSVGEGGTGGAPAQQLDSLGGKILRLDPDNIDGDGDGIAKTNPFINTPGARKEIYAYGLRNPFRMAFTPDGTSFYINDVGQNTWEEIDRGIAGANYGWNQREGFCNVGSTTSCPATPVGFTDPLYAYVHPGGAGRAITGGAFVPTGVWPSDFDGDYLFADYVAGTIQRFHPGTKTVSDFITGLGGSSASDLQFGPADGGGQALYYATFGGGGQIRRISAVSGNRTPIAQISVSTTGGALPFTTTFDASASSDADLDALTYVWHFGDGATQETSTPTVAHTYTTAGTLTATLAVRDSHGATSPSVSLTVYPGNLPPTATITSPAPNTAFAVGQTITLTGVGNDPETGALSGASLHWVVLRHHNDHTHPWADLTGASVSFVTPAPEDLDAAANSFLEVTLTATDPAGQQTTVRENLQPHKVIVTVTSSPAGATVNVFGEPFTTPTVITSWEGWALDVAAPPSFGLLGFQQWADTTSAKAARLWTTPSASGTITANYTSAPPSDLATVGSFTSQSPQRLLDTRTGRGIGGTPRRLGSDAVLTVDVLGLAGVPSSGVDAVLVNLTGVIPTADTYLTAYPAGAVRPTASNLNLVPGQIDPNLAVVKLGDSGRMSIYNYRGSLDVVIDVLGWYGRSTTGSGTLRPLTPYRALDTRGPVNPISANSSRTLKVLGVGGVPTDGVSAVAINLTATNETADGYLTVFPAGASVPDASNLNFVARQTTATAALAKVGTDGSISIYNYAGSSDVIVDIVGYVTNTTTATGAITAFTPQRIVDTRIGLGAPKTKVAAQSVIVCTIPAGLAGASAVAVNVTAVSPTADGYLTAYPFGGTRPGSSSLNMVRGAPPTANLVITGVDAGGRFSLFNFAGSTDVVVDLVGWYQ